MNDEEIEALAAEAEVGYDPAAMRDRHPHGRPAGPGIAQPEPMKVLLGACRYCGSEEAFTVTWRLKTAGPPRCAGPMLTPQVEAYWWPWARCEHCGHESEGEITHDHEDDEA